MVRHGIHHAYVYGRNLANQITRLEARIVRHTNGEVDFGTCCQSRKAVASERTSRRFHSL